MTSARTIRIDEAMIERAARAMSTIIDGQVWEIASDTNKDIKRCAAAMGLKLALGEIEERRKGERRALETCGGMPEGFAEELAICQKELRAAEYKIWQQDQMLRYARGERPTDPPKQDQNKAAEPEISEQMLNAGTAAVMKATKCDPKVLWGTTAVNVYRSMYAQMLNEKAEREQRDKNVHGDWSKHPNSYL